jgi:acyl-CoA dehydrogenase
MTAALYATGRDQDTSTPLERVRQVLPILREQATAVDEQAQFPVAGLDALRRSGLMGLLVPAAYGGLGGTLRQLTQVSAELGGACVSTAMIWAMHCQQAAALVAHGGPELRERVLPRIADGEIYLASVTTEKRKGGHLLSADSPLERCDGRLVISRDAPIVTGGRYADGFLITARDGADAPPSAVSLVYADSADLTVTTGGEWNPMGMRGTHSGPLHLDGSVPASQLVGAPGGFRTVAVHTFAPYGHIGWAACWLGAARGAFSRFLHLARSTDGRRQFDLRSDLLRARVARIRLELDTAAAMLAQTIRDVEQSPDLEEPTVQMRLNGLKVLAAERSFAVVDHLVEMVGLRHGYMRGASVGLEQVFRDLRSASLNYGNDRLLAANGALALMDREVRLAC